MNVILLLPKVTKKPCIFFSLLPLEYFPYKSQSECQLGQLDYRCLQQHGCELRGFPYGRLVFTTCCATLWYYTVWGWWNPSMWRNCVCVCVCVEGRLQVTLRFGRGWAPICCSKINYAFVELFNDFPLNLGKNLNSLIWPNESWHLTTKCQECSACIIVTNKNVSQISTWQLRALLLRLKTTEID